MRASTSLGGRRINVSFLLLGIFALTPQVSCQPSKPADTGVDARAVQDFNVNAADIFPVSHNKRLIGGLLSTVLDAVLPGGATTTTTQQTPAASSNQAPAPATSPTTTPQNQQTTAGSSPTTAGNSPATSPGATNQPVNPGATSDVASNTQGSGNTSSPGKNGGGSGQSSVSGAAGASTTTGTVSRVITDHFGNTIAVTGTEPITLTYLTTLPNGVVSTVTEIVTPTSADSTSENGASNGLSPGKIAAVVATLVTVFLVVFAIAMLLLMLRKRRRAIQLTRSRPTSASSFGSASDEFAYDSRRNSRAALAPMTSTSSFKTAPAYVDGAKLDFPLPPVPGAPQTSSSKQRPLSGVSDGTFDFGFKEQQMSRASIIEERNFYQKIGNYPVAGTYTPFAVAPTSEMGHGDEPLFSPTDLDAAFERGRTAGKLAYDEDRRSRTSELYEANPFSDPSPSMAQTAPIHDSNNKSNLLTASSARQSSLWRKPTFGSSTGKASAQENRLTTSYDDHTVRSNASTSEYGTARASDNQSLHHYTSSSEDHHSFHSAFEHSSQMPGATGSSRAADNQNPFADTNASSSQVTLSTIKGGSLRPDTATSSGKASVVSSVINPQFGRDLSLSPDPKELFYRAPGTGQSQVSSNGSMTRISEDSRRSSDGTSTIRASTGSRFAYPSLQQVLERNEGPSATKH